MDVGHYLAALRRTWWVVLAGLVLGCLTGGLVALLTPPTYVSTAQFYVSVGVVPGLSPRDAAQLAQQRVASYVLLARSDELAAEVAADVATEPSGAGLTAAAVAAMLDSRSEINTALVTVTVSGPSRELGRAVALSLVDRFPPMVERLERTADGAVAIAAVGAPQSPSRPVAPDRTVDLLLGLAAGTLLGLVAAVLRELFDTRVRGADAVRRLLGVPVVAEIDDPDAPAGRARLDELRTALAGKRLLVVTDGVSTAPELTAARDKFGVLAPPVAGAVLLRPTRRRGRHSAKGLDLLELTGLEVGPGSGEPEHGDRGGRERPSELVDGGRG